MFNVKECGFDDGDCVTCNELVEDPKKIGNGYCDGGLYLDAPECNDDGGVSKKEAFQVSLS